MDSSSSMRNASPVGEENTRQNSRDSPSDVEMLQGDEDESDSSPSDQKPRYAKNERVYAKDNIGNKHYYPATVLQVRFRKNEWRFKVHYLGWNSRWDQWLPDERIMKDSEQNRKFLEISKLLGGSKKDDTTNNAAAATAAAEVKSKRKRDDERSSRKRRGGVGLINVKSIYEDFCELPLTLKTVLMDELERITRAQPYDCSNMMSTTPTKAPDRVVHQLPAPVTVKQVLKHFCKKRIQQLDNNGSAATDSDKDGGSKASAERPATLSADDVQVFCDGLSSLFEEALPKFLLYPQERPQFEAMMRKEEMAEKPLAEIYGCEYLLRLYVRLPVLMQSESAFNVKLVGPLLAELLILMQKNRQACFKGSYRDPRPDEWLDCEKISLRSPTSPGSKAAMDLCD